MIFFFKGKKTCIIERNKTLQLGNVFRLNNYTKQQDRHGQTDRNYNATLP